ncbi:MAG: hypothetical protein ABSC48_02695 [Terracidiphilus sp.]|jgi:hypothetical protein
MAALQVQTYLGRARDFLEGFNLLRDDLDEFRFSSALLGIHCAISYSDALRTGMGCSDVSSEDHRSAADDLKKRLSEDRGVGSLRGVEHLKTLLSKKGRVAYATETVRRDEVEDIVKHARRFADWAEKTGRILKIWG